MTDINKIFKTMKNGTSDLVEAVEDLGWYKNVFNFIARNYKSVILKSDNSEHEIKILDIEGFARLIKTNQHANEKDVKSFDSLRESFVYLMTWYDIDKQIKFNKEYNELSGNEDVIVEEDDGFKD